MIVSIEELKKNDFFKLEKGKKVYISKGYCRTNKKYCANDYEDISNFRYLKKGTKVKVGF